MKTLKILISSFLLMGFVSDTKSDAIIQNHIDVIGGKTAIDTIKDVTIKAKIKKNGIVFDEVNYHKRPNKFLQIQSFKGVEFKRIYSNGSSITIVNTDLKGQQKVFNVNKKSVEMMNLRQSIFKIVDLEKYKTQKTYKGLITVNKTICHEIEYKLNNATWDCYFDSKSGLLLTETEISAMQVNGVVSRYSQKMTQNVGFIPINDIYFVLKSKTFENKVLVAESDYFSFEVNKNIKDEIFNFKK